MFFHHTQSSNQEENRMQNITRNLRNTKKEGNGISRLFYEVSEFDFSKDCSSTV